MVWLWDMGQMFHLIIRDFIIVYIPGAKLSCKIINSVIKTSKTKQKGSKYWIKNLFI